MVQGAWLLSKLAAKHYAIHVVLVFQACSHGSYHQEFEKKKKKFVRSGRVLQDWIVGRESLNKIYVKLGR